MNSFSMHVSPHIVVRQHCRGSGQSAFVVQRIGLLLHAFLASGLDGVGQPVGLMTTKINI